MDIIYTEVCHQGNEQRDYAFGGSTDPSGDARDHAGVDPDLRWSITWRFILIAGLNIVAGSYSNKQESVAAPQRSFSKAPLESLTTLDDLWLSNLPPASL